MPNAVHISLSNERTSFRYLPVSPKVKSLGAYVLNAGFTTVAPNSVYPPFQHPPDHHCVTQGRTLPSYILVYITRGAGVFGSKSRRNQPVRAGDLIALFPRVWHYYRPLTETGWDEYWIEFDGDYLRRLMTCEAFSPNEPIQHIGVRDGLLDRFLDAVKLLNNEPPEYQLMLGTLAAQTIAQVLSMLKQQNCDQRAGPNIIREAKRWLVHDPIQSGNTDSLASRLNMSYSSFRRLFKVETGFSPHRFVLEAKMQKASNLLVRTDAAPHLIAEQCGMDSHYFSRLFKKKTGLTPTAFRRLHRTH